MTNSPFPFFRFLFKQVVFISAILIILAGICVGLLRSFLPFTSEYIETKYFGPLITAAKVDANWSGSDIRLSLSEVQLDHWFGLDKNTITPAKLVGQALLNHPIKIKRITATWHRFQLLLSLEGMNINNVLVARNITANTSLAAFLRFMMDDKYWQPLLLEQSLVVFDPVNIQVLASFLAENAHRALSTFSGNDKAHYIAANLRMLKTMRPTGKMDNLQLNVHNGAVIISGKFSELELQRWQGLPALNGISGDFQGDGKKGVLNINAADARFHFETAVKMPIKLKELVGIVRWKALPNRIELLSDSIIAKTKDIETRSRFHLKLFDGSPFIDLQTHFLIRNVSTLADYVTTALIDVQLLTWYRALERGEIKDGVVVIYGVLDDFPFINNNGRFYVECEIDDMVLNHQKTGVLLNNFAAKLQFSEDTLQVSGAQGTFNNTKIIDVDAKIESVRYLSLLQINGTLQSSTAEMMRLFTDVSTVKGVSNIIIDKLTIPFDNQPITIKGKVSLVDSSFTFAQDKLNLQKINGELRFLDINIPDDHSKFKANMEINNLAFVLPDTNMDVSIINGKVSIDIKGLRSEMLTVRLFDRPARVSINTERSATIVNMSGVIAAPNVAKILNNSLIDQYAKGETSWTSIIRIPRASSSEAPSVLVSSDLKGISVALPAPLAKSASQKRRLIVKTDFKPIEKNIAIDYGLQLRSRFKLKKENVGWRINAGNIRFDNKKPALPLSGHLSIEGDLSKASLTPWFKYIRPIDTKSQWQMPFQEVYVSLKKFVMMGQHFRDTAIRIKQKRGVLTALLDGRDIAGMIVFPKEGAELQPIKVSLAYLYLQKARYSVNNDGDTLENVDPRVILPLRVIIRRLTYNEVKLGSFEFGLYPAKHKNGVNIDSLRLLSSEFDIDGSGHWLVIGKQEQFDLKGGFKSADLTGALKVFGYDNDLTSRKTEITYDVSWQGGPLDFSIKPLTGRIEAKMEKGQLAKGLTFDQFKSTFAIKAGEARAHGSVRYDVPSVVVEATGWTDLERETYDLTVLITANRTQTAPVYVMPSVPGADWITFPKEKPTT